MDDDRSLEAVAVACRSRSARSRARRASSGSCRAGRARRRRSGATCPRLACARARRCRRAARARPRNRAPLRERSRFARRASALGPSRQTPATPEGAGVRPSAVALSSRCGTSLSRLTSRPSSWTSSNASEDSSPQQLDERRERLPQQAVGAVQDAWSVAHELRGGEQGIAGPPGSCAQVADLEHLPVARCRCTRRPRPPRRRARATATSTTPACSSASSTWQTIGRFATRCSEVARVAPSHGPVHRVVLGTTTTPLLSTSNKRGSGPLLARTRRRNSPADVRESALRGGRLDARGKPERNAVVAHRSPRHLHGGDDVQAERDVRAGFLAGADRVGEVLQLQRERLLRFARAGSPRRPCDRRAGARRSWRADRRPCHGHTRAPARQRRCRRTAPCACCRRRSSGGPCAAPARRAARWPWCRRRR